MVWFLRSDAIRDAFVGPHFKIINETPELQEQWGIHMVVNPIDHEGQRQMQTGGKCPRRAILCIMEQSQVVSCLRGHNERHIRQILGHPLQLFKKIDNQNHFQQDFILGQDTTDYNSIRTVGSRINFRQACDLVLASYPNMSPMEIVDANILPQWFGPDPARIQESTNFFRQHQALDSNNLVEAPVEDDTAPQVRQEPRIAAAEPGNAAPVHNGNGDAGTAHGTAHGYETNDFVVADGAEHPTNNNNGGPP